MRRWTRQPATRGRARGCCAFTLVELVVVIVIMAVMAVVALPAMSSAAGTRTAVAANQIRRDLGYARERTLATGIRAWVVFSPGTNSYSVLEEPIGNPGRSNALTMTDPVTGRTFAQSLSAPEFAGTVLVSAVFDSGSEVGFDWKGRPLNATGALLAAQGVVTLSGGRTVTVKAGSGLADTP